MNQKVRFNFDLTPKKLHSLHRFLLILSKLQKQFGFRYISQSFCLMAVSIRKDTQKFAILEAITKRIMEQAFLTIKSDKKKVANKNKLLQSIRNLPILVLAQFLQKKLRQNKFHIFEKLIAFKINNESSKINTFLSKMTNVLENFKKRVLLGKGFERLKKICLNHKNLNKFFKNIDLFISKARTQNLEESFQCILREGFRKIYREDVQRRQNYIIEGRINQLSKHEQIRILRTDINAMTKALQLQEASKRKSKKEDYDRNLILQAKNTQKQRSAQQFRKIAFENNSLIHEFNKKQCYMKLQEESRILAENTQHIYKKTYELLKAEKNKQSINFKELLILGNRENIDLKENLKKFSLSKQSIILENIDLKNLENLYQRQIQGYGVGVNIKESEAYRKTMEQNVNLREVLQILLAKIVQGKQKSISLPREELNLLTETSYSSQQRAKLTLITLSSSSNSFAH